MKRIIFLTVLWLAATLTSRAQDWDRPDTRLPYRAVNGKLIVDVEVNGQVLPFVFDTGAGICCVMDSLYTGAGLDSLSVRRLTDSGGRVNDRPVARIDTLRLGGWVITQKEVFVLDSKNPLFECFGVAGIIGSDILQDRVVRFSSRDSIILLVQHAGQFGLKPRDGIKARLWAGKRPFIKVSVRNGDQKSAHWTLFDSGALDYSLRHDHFSFLERDGVIADLSEGVGRRSYGVHGVENESRQRRGVFPEIFFGRTSLGQVPVNTTSGNNSLLGAFLLKQGNVTIDYRKKRFYFEPWEYPARMEDRHLFSLSLIPVQGEVVVGVVWDEALRGVIRSGDRVVSIDGRPAGEYAACDFFTGEVSFKKGVPVTVETSSGDLFEIEL